MVKFLPSKGLKFGTSQEFLYFASVTNNNILLGIHEDCKKFISYFTGVVNCKEYHNAHFGSHFTSLLDCSEFFFFFKRTTRAKKVVNWGLSNLRVDRLFLSVRLEQLRAQRMYSHNLLLLVPQLDV